MTAKGCIGRPCIAAIMSPSTGSAVTSPTTVFLGNASEWREPSERVNMRCWVRSTRAERRVLSAMMLTPMKRIAAQTRATIAVMERFMSCFSIRFLEVDEHGVGEQERADHREEKDRV